MYRVTLTCSSVARAAGIEWTARTILQVWTKTIGRVGTAGNVWHACIVGDKAGFGLDKLVDSSGTAAVARASGIGTTVENVLNGQIYFIPTLAAFRRCELGNLDAICQATECSMSPTGATILSVDGLFKSLQ
jgi:hypothetical protein